MKYVSGMVVFFLFLIAAMVMLAMPTMLGFNENPVNNILAGTMAGLLVCIGILLTIFIMKND